MLPLVLTVLAGVLLDAIHASSDVGALQFCASSCDQYLRNHLDSRPSCMAKPFLLPSNNTTDLFLFSHWLSCFVFFVIGLGLGAACRTRVNLPYFATRTSSHLERPSPQINGAEVIREAFQGTTQTSQSLLSSFLVQDQVNPNLRLLSTTSPTSVCRT